MTSMGRLVLTPSSGVRLGILFLTNLYVGRVGDTLRSARRRAEAEAGQPGNPWKPFASRS
jgi:hypothetical protein